MKKINKKTVKKETKKIPKLEIGVLVILLILFFGIIGLYSLSLNSVNTQYEFQQTAVSKSDQRTIIGEIKIDNPNMLPARINLKEFVACSLDDSNTIPSYIFIDYETSLDISSELIVPEFNSRGERYIDVGPFSQNSINIIVNHIGMRDPSNPNRTIEELNVNVYEVSYRNRWNNNCESLQQSEPFTSLIITQNE